MGIYYWHHFLNFLRWCGLYVCNNSLSYSSCTDWVTHSLRVFHFLENKSLVATVSRNILADLALGPNSQFFGDPNVHTWNITVLFAWIEILLKKPVKAQLLPDVCQWLQDLHFSKWSLFCSPYWLFTCMQPKPARTWFVNRSATINRN